MVWLVIVLIYDQVIYFLISFLFHKSKFLDFGNLYTLSYSFNIIYCMLSGIILPNFAMQNSFMEISSSISIKASKILANYLINGLYFNFITLIISAAQFKLIQPFVLKYLIEKLKKNSKKNKSNSFNFLGEFEKLKKLSTDLKTQERSQNTSFIFSLAFSTNCVFCVSFYGLLIPKVFVYILPAYFILILVDYYCTRKTNKSKDLKNILNQIKSFENSPDKIQKEFELYDSVLEQKKIGQQLVNIFELNKIKRKLSKIEQIPNTIYLNFVNILVFFSFPVILMGYFGMTSQFEYFLTYHESFYEQNTPSLIQRLHGYISKTVKKLFIEEKIMNIEEMFEGILKNIWSILKNTIIAIKSDNYLIYAFYVYLSFCLFQFFFYRIETFQRRTRRSSKLNKSISNISHDKGYRNLNPAYQIIQTQSEEFI